MSNRTRALLLAGLTLGALPAAAPAAGPSRDIQTYVLFALDQLSFKGANGCPACGMITGGDVGVNRVDPGQFTPNLSLGGVHNPVTMDDGTEVVADTARLGAKLSAFDVFANVVQPNFDPGVVRGAGPTPFTAPILASLPTFPAFVPGTTRELVSAGDTLALPPGAYGAVVVAGKGTLTLAAGVYDIVSLKLGKRGIVNTVPGTIVHVARTMRIGNDSFVGSADEAQFFVRSDATSANTPSVSFGRRTEFHGTVYAPNGVLSLGNTTHLVGRFWARAIGSDFNVNVNHGPSTEGPCATCDHDGSGNVVEVVVDQNVTVDLAPASPTCTGDTDLCAFFTFDKSGPTADTWTAIFDVGARRLVVKNGATITTAEVPQIGNNRYAPGIRIVSSCALVVEREGAIVVQSTNRDAGDIVLQIQDDVTINGTVSNSVAGTLGLPGDVKVATCCGDITTGDHSVIESLGVDPGGSDVDLVACCAGGDINLSGLVMARAKAHAGGPRPNVKVAAFHGGVTVNANGVEPILDETTVGGGKFDLFGGLLSWVTAADNPGSVFVQAERDVVVHGHGDDPTPPVRTSFAAVAAGTGTSNATGGLVDVRSLAGRIVGTDRAFEVFGRFNADARVRLWAAGDVALSRPGANASFDPVVDTSGGSTGSGGTNELRAFAGGITVGAAAEVSATGGTPGTNLLTACTGVTNAGVVTPADANAADDAGSCSPAAPAALFADCSAFGIAFP